MLCPKSFVAVALLGGAGAVPAQIVLPQRAASQAGHGFHVAFSTDFRVQQGWPAAALAPSRATLRSVAWRASRHPSAAMSAWPGKSYSTFTVELHRLGRPLPLAANLANNRANTLALFNGSISFPPLSAAPVLDGRPAPWGLTVPFASPAVVDTQLFSTVVLEITATGASNQAGYPLDAEVLFGAVTPFGPRRGNLLAATGGRLGGRVSFSIPSPTTGPALLVLGGSSTRAGSFALPLDLGPFGAPGEHLLVSPDIALPMSRTRIHVHRPPGAPPWPITFSMYAESLSIPFDPRLVGARGFAQAVLFDPTKALPIATTNGVALTIDALPHYEAHSLVDSGSGSGWGIDPAVVRFTGQFQ